MDDSPVKISVISPIFNEEEGIEAFFERLWKVLSSLGMAFEIVFVDDGSQDRSFEILKKIRQRSPRQVRIMRLARNFGHQLAISAGIKTARGQAAVVIDSDLQDPPELITQFVEKWQDGIEIVLGVRKERRGETFFKLISAQLFYKLIRLMTNIDIPANVGDFYLLDRKVIDVINKMEERHRFIRGMIARVGFKRTGVEYIREARVAGSTKYNIWRMLKFSLDAATSFSFIPLRAISLFGMLMAVCSFVGIMVTLYYKIFTDRTILGWASLLTIILFIGGIQMLALGLLGEYIARIGDDVKHRPLYIVGEVLEEA